MSKQVIPQRMTATIEDEFCIFLIGMRINRPLKVHKWFPVFMAMPKMLRELGAQPELGYLHGHLWLGRTILMLQYWRSAQHLEDYARNKSLQHVPAWGAFTRAVGDSGDVGIWHETYQVKAGTYECVYHNMPPFGLGAVGNLIPATGRYQNAKDRFVAHQQ